uniref:NADH-ubiquinone oxidoreductase chain 6 n=1 Tax=Lachnaia pubescens TaxID=1425578 RepID=A0A3G1GQD9_9CUCU|nr:NADH dehydrogenase subunit 6 [Lachnaia pubescens]
MLISMIIITSITFCLMKHPLTSGLTLLIQTVLIAMISGTMNLDFWFSYIVFLIMIGGMLVLFIYMTSVASNEKFKFSLPMTIFITSGTVASASTILIDSALNLYSLRPIEMSPDKIKISAFLLNKYLNYPHSMIYLLMVTYLLITLIAVVKITIKTKSTLRQKF